MQTDLRQIAGVDAERGIKRFAGNEETFLGVLRSYAVNTRPLLESIKDVHQDNLDDYAIVVHGIKGSSRGIFAEELGALAEALEEAAKAGDFDFVGANNPVFLELAGKLVADIDRVFRSIAVMTVKPKKDKPDKEALSRFLVACQNYDIDEIDAIMTEIDSYEYESDEGLVLWLLENAEQMNYPQIVEKLS